MPVLVISKLEVAMPGTPAWPGQHFSPNTSHGHVCDHGNHNFETICPNPICSQLSVTKIAEFRKMQRPRGLSEN